MEIHFHQAIKEIPEPSWQSLAVDDYPFLQYQFLLTLEESGCVSDETGWYPQHVLLKSDDGEILAFMPLYIKTHSSGEYVFDWSWADAYRQNSLRYYPKLLTAIPFTPATGPRLLLAADANLDDVYGVLLQGIHQRAEALNISSWHLLFPNDAHLAALQSLQNANQQSVLGFRMGCQYHWLNRDYQDFDHFLASFRSPKRKNVKKERMRVAAQGLTLHHLEGHEITPEIWTTFYRFYANTYWVRGREPYLNETFFQLLGQRLAEHLVMVLAQKDNQYVAGALCFKSQTTLYGRYWGCEQEFDMLHFEACYYQGIDYCIAHQLKRFDPGAQGQHKIPRGFNPTATWSSHWIEHPQFRHAVNDFCQREAVEMQSYIEDAQTRLPFKRVESE